MMRDPAPLPRLLNSLHGPAHLNALHEAGRSRLDSGLAGLAESWRYTSLAGLDETGWTPAAQAPQTIDRAPVALIEGTPRLVLINGVARPDLSGTTAIPAGVTLTPLAAASPEQLAHLGTLAAPDDGLVQSLNSAGVSDGLLLEVAPGTAVETPIELDWLALASDRPLSVLPRLYVRLGRGAALTLVENRRGMGETLELRVTEIEIADGAALTHLIWSDADQTATSLSAAAVRLGRDARLHSVTLTTGGRLTRGETAVTLAAPGGEATVNNAWLLRGRQHADTVVRIQHAAPHGVSHQLAKGVLDDAARGVFQGRIGVSPHAQKTDGYQMSRSLLLSPDAAADAKPELEIFADDVKCSHGSTTGRLDDASLFYLQSRGIPRAEAEMLLIRAFVEEVIDTIPNCVREPFAARAHEWLNSRLSRGGSA